MKPLILIIISLFVKAQELIHQLFLILIVYFHQDFKMNLNLKILQIKSNNLNQPLKNKRKNKQRKHFKLKMLFQNLNKLKINEWKKIIH